MTTLAPSDYAPFLPDLEGVPAFLVTLDHRGRPVIAWANEDFVGLSGMRPSHRSTAYLDDLLTDLGVEEPCSDVCPGMSAGRWTVRGSDRDGRACWYEFDIRRAAGLQAETGRPSWIWFVSSDSAAIAARMRVAEAFGLAEQGAAAPASAGNEPSVGRDDAAYLLDVAHEMRTPLAAVIGALSLLRERHAEDDSARRLIEMATRNADQLSALTAGLLDVPGTGERAFPIAPEPVSASELLSDAVRAYAATALQERVFLSVDRLPDDVWLRADPRRLHQVLTNLISNAIKYAPAGTAVNVSCVVRDGAVAFTVSDRGRGIPAADREKVFGRHFQAGRPGQDRPEGAGLGLSIVKDLVERQGGRIVLSSRTRQDGAGSTGTDVTVAFPRLEKAS